MMQRPGLYFPYVHVRDDDWLKAAALYWPDVRRLVPAGYSKHDSLTAQAFVEAEILRDEDPEIYLNSLTWDLLQAMRRNAELLARDYSLEHASTNWDGHQWTAAGGPNFGRPELGWIHVTKFPHGVVDYLSELGLAQLGRTEGHGWPVTRDMGQWIGLHPALASAYMTALAGRLGEQAHLEPLTDQVDLRVATPSSDAGAALQLLIGRSDPGPRANLPSEAVATYVMLAMQYAHPANLKGVPATKIIECREKLVEELAKFRDHVTSQQDQLAELAAIPITARRLEAFAEHVQHTVEIPLRSLERGLKLLKLEPTRSLLLAGSFTTPAVMGAASKAAHLTHPVATSVASAAVAVGAAWWQLENIRRADKSNSPVGYLLGIRDELTPKSLAARALKVLRGTYGRR
ncbi:DUF6236 family protein [Micromonospora arida]|uniref:DUF6236 family protein n=1 Tax=Micromonospora arida TaxID=2203715 RepID=UPI003CF4DACB